MRITRIDRAADVPFVEGLVWGPSGNQARLRLILDTGAGMTVIVPGVLDRLGYNPRDAERMTVIRSAVGEERGYLLRVMRFRSLGFEFRNQLIHAHDLGDHPGIDGLLGWDILRLFNFEIHPQEGRISAARISPRR